MGTRPRDVLEGPARQPHRFKLDARIGSAAAPDPANERQTGPTIGGTIASLKSGVKNEAVA
jgi:hypothetical protein